jgi:hypothetical protein
MSAQESEQAATTDFQLHVVREGRNVIDYTEQKLKRYAKMIKDPKQQEVLHDLMHKYIDGSIAICWKGGLPAWLNIK